MVDRFTTEHRSRIMASVRSRDTKAELRVRSLAHRLGYRFRLHRNDLPGSPDLAFPRLKKVIFVHGCFWHRHGCHRTTTPASNRAFWEQKFQRNISRDAKALNELRLLGWEALVIWECELKDERLKEKIRKFLQNRLPGGPRSSETSARRRQTRQMSHRTPKPYNS